MSNPALYYIKWHVHSTIDGFPKGREHFCPLMTLRKRLLGKATKSPFLVEPRGRAIDPNPFINGKISTPNWANLAKMLRDLVISQG